MNVTPDEITSRLPARRDARKLKWLGLPVAQPAGNTLAEILKVVPQFGRQPFAMASVNGSEVAINPYLDMVYCMPLRRDSLPVPIGVVSKNYRLVDHQQVLRTINDALNDLDIVASDLAVTAEWTLHGERARFSLLLPEDERFQLPVGGGSTPDNLRFRIEVFNSVEGSCRLMVVAGWLRFVCSNGLILGTALFHIRQQHRQQLEIEQLGQLLKQALCQAADDQRVIRVWQGKRVSRDVLRQWVDTEVKERWGLKAAARVFAICRTGQDAELKGDVKNKLPSEVEVNHTGDVPGSACPARTVFDVSQALTWVAGQRRDLQEDLEWRTQVYELTRALLNSSGGLLDNDLSADV